MNQENVAKLIEALRSGYYEQGKGYLRVGNEYCCLGVACEISGIGRWKYLGPDWRYEIIDDDDDRVIESNSSVLPDEMARWLSIEASGQFDLLIDVPPEDIREEYGENYSTSAITSLAELNDAGLTFDQIADILENANTFEWKSAPEPPEIGEDEDEDEDEGVNWN